MINRKTARRSKSGIQTATIFLKPINTAVMGVPTKPYVFPPKPVKEKTIRRAAGVRNRAIPKGRRR